MVVTTVGLDEDALALSVVASDVSNGASKTGSWESVDIASADGQHLGQLGVGFQHLGQLGAKLLLLLLGHCDYWGFLFFECFGCY